MRHSQSCSGPPSASLAGWPQVGHRGGSMLMLAFYRVDPKIFLLKQAFDFFRSFRARRTARRY